MKTFFRAMAGFLLVVVLFGFTVWRQDAFPDLSGITNFIADTADRLNNIKNGGANLMGAGGRPTDENADFPKYDVSTAINPELEDLVYTAMLALESEIDISGYALSPDDLQAFVSQIRFLHPDLFFVDKQFNFTKDDQTNTIMVLKPHYLYDETEHNARMATYRHYVQTIAAGAPAQGSEFDKVLYLHDYFVREYSYDNTYTIRDAYTFFEVKTGVCQAYMLAFIAVAEELGIESVPVTSSRMNHAWNLVKVDGNWYHVDVTWDDTAGYPSQTSYAYFLQSDAGIINIDKDRVNESAANPDWHCDWSCTQRATETRYDNAVWRTSQSPIIKGNGVYYCAVYTEVDETRNQSGAIYAGDNPAVMGELLPIHSIWRAEGGEEYYLGCYTGLALYGDLLIYNTHNTLRAYHVTEKRDQLLKIFAEIGSDCIYGIAGVGADGTVSCVVSSVASEGEYYLLEHKL